MSRLQPATVSAPETAADDPRLGHLLGAAVEDPEAARVVLLGFPSDEGVRINGGRPGAAEAPDHIRQVLYKLTPDARSYGSFTTLLSRTVDLGNLVVTGDVARDQERLGEVLAPHLTRGAVPVILGGGHETTFGHFLGYVQARRPVKIINWDAHLDVRPPKDGQPHSGSSFRLALEHPSGLCRGYTVAGLLPHSAARAHVDYVKQHRGHLLWRDNLSPARIDMLYDELNRDCLTTFDLDALDQAAAPGVSAPGAGGMPVAWWLQAAYRAGRSLHVTSMDVVEMNPTVDADGRTARLAALTIWQFLRGVAKR